jgi:hypothetical protein
MRGFGRTVAALVGLVVLLAASAPASGHGQPSRQSAC